MNKRIIYTILWRLDFQSSTFGPPVSHLLGNHFKERVHVYQVYKAGYVLGVELCPWVDMTAGKLYSALPIKCIDFAVI